jgi:hypothetical protein
MSAMASVLVAKPACLAQSSRYKINLRSSTESGMQAKCDKRDEFGDAAICLNLAISFS